jgi:acetate kinase
MAILAVNAGSSTLKFSVYPTQGGEVQASILSGNIQGLEPGGQATVGWSWQGQSHQQALERGEGSAFASALRHLAGLLAALPDLPALDAVAHRVVHGGQAFSQSVVVNDDTLQRLAQLNSLAPLHQPHNLQGIRAFREVFASLPQVACFDTAYHATLAEIDVRFALPEALAEQGVRRYGFHGLSYQYIIGTLLQHSARARAGC